MVHLSKNYTFGEMHSNTSLISEIKKLYGDKIRVRACGVLIKNSKILLLKHEGIGPLGYFWNVPGGSPEDGESLYNCLKREFLEEVKLNVLVGEFLYLNEYIKPPLHALETYFKVSVKNGTPELGLDPEMKEGQILSELSWMSMQELKSLPRDSYPTFISKIWKL